MLEKSFYALSEKAAKITNEELLNALETTQKLFFLGLIISIVLIIIAYKKSKNANYLVKSFLTEVIALLFYNNIKTIENLYGNTDDIVMNRVTLVANIGQLAIAILPVLVVIIYSIYKIKKAEKIEGETDNNIEGES